MAHYTIMILRVEIRSLPAIKKSNCTSPGPAISAGLSGEKKGEGEEILLLKITW